LAATAYAQVARMLPADGKLGELGGDGQPFPMVQISSKVVRLAPGALIFDQMNRTILHGQLPSSGTVLYTVGPAEDITRIYILRPEEIELVRRNNAAR